jgi:thiol-disulfide isomerase/thioredoxin
MNTPRMRLLGVALIVLLGIWLGLKTHLVRGARHDGGVRVPAGVASAPTVSDNSPSEVVATPEEFTPHAIVPARLPDFSLKDLQGKSTPISAWSGKSLVINFWATWCAPCRREIPLLKSLRAEWAARDLEVIGIAVDHPDKVQEFAGRFKIDYPVLIGEQDALDVAAKFGMDSPAFPFTVFTDRRGEVVALFVGELHRPQLDFILSEVQNLNQDRVHLPEAHRAIAEGLQALAEKPAS